MGRQPAVGRPDAPRSARRRRALAGRPAVPARHRPAPGRRPRLAAAAARSTARAAVPLGPLSLVDDAPTLVRGILERDGSSELPVDDAASTSSSTAAAATRCSSSSSPPWRSRAPSQSELPGSLRALIAARLDQLPPPQRAIVDNAAVLGPADRRSARSSEFAPAMQPGVPPRRPRRSWPPTACSTSTAAGGGSAATSCARSPTRRSPSGSGPSATPAWRWRSPPRRASTSTDRRRRPPRRDGGRAARRARPVDGVPPSITGHAVQALLEAAPAARRHRSRSSTPSVTPAGRSTCTERRSVARAAAAARARRRPSSSGASSPTPAPTPSEVLESALADGDEIARGRGPPPARHRSPRCRATSPTARRRARRRRRPVPPRRRRQAARQRAARARLRRGVRRLARRRRGPTSTRRWTIYPRDRRRARPRLDRTRTWRGSAFQARRLRRRRDAARGGQARFEELGDRNGVSWAEGLLAYVLVLPAPLRRGRGAGHRRSSGDARRWGDTLGAADDADAARQPAAVDRPARRGRAAAPSGRSPGSARSTTATG